MKKRSHLPRRAALLAVAALASVSAGCAVVAIGAIVGTVAYAEGELSAVLDADMYRTVDATKTAASRLQLRPTSQTGDESGAKMVAVDRYGNRVTVKLQPEGPRMTRVSIRVNAFGDEAYSRRVLSEIQRNL